jgi:hypothetical protein
MTLQFDTAATNCAACKQPVSESYYTVGKAVVCANCKARIQAAKPTRVPPVLVARGAVCGVGGAALGAALYYGVLAATGYEIALVAIAVGFIVGRAVQLGARGQRGLSLQIVAVALTYVGIAAGYVPQVMPYVKERPLAALTIPVMATFGKLPYSLISGLIIGVGLWQAWIMNRPSSRLAFQGPFRVGARA